MHKYIHITYIYLQSSPKVNSCKLKLNNICFQPNRLEVHGKIFIQILFYTFIAHVQGPVSFNDMGVRIVNRLRMLQYRRVPTGEFVCV